MSVINRNLFLDVVRGMAILFVVFGHAIQSANDMNPGLPLQKIIMTFWMPLFFIISGYVDGVTCGGKGIINKVNRLLVPYLVWTILVFFIGVITDKVLFTFEDCFFEIVSSQFWFLRVLFFVWLIVYFSRTIYKKLSVRVSKNISIIITSLGYIFLVGLFSLIGGFGILKYSALYLFGLSLFLAFKYIKYYFRVLVAFICFILFFMSVWFLFNTDNVWFKRFVDLSMAFTGSGMVCALAIVIVRFKDSFLCRGLSYCGKISLEIYAVHWCLLFNPNLLKINVFQNFGYSTYFIAIIGFIIWMMMSLSIIYVIKLLPGCAFVFNGFNRRGK